jgi:hypothetical protein
LLSIGDASSRNKKRGTALGNHFVSYRTRNAIQRRTAMPVILLWAVPAVFVLGGVTYLIVK